MGIFFNGTGVLHGKQEVLAAWSRFFKDKAAPFSWKPDRVEVLQSVTLALSTGLVRDPAGKVIGRFNSIWRREAPGVWRVVFDKGTRYAGSRRLPQALGITMNAVAKLSPYRWRTSLRRHLPWFLIDLGIAGKGKDCEAAGGSHSWYNLDGKSSGCYHCKVVRTGRLWEHAND